MNSTRSSWVNMGLRFPALTIVQTIRKHRFVCLDDLSNQIGANYRTVVELTGILEIDGFICIDMLRRCTIIYK